MEIHNRIVYGDVYWIDLDGLDQNRGGHFIRGKRPCVVVSNDYNNAFCSLITVIPLTTRVHDLPQHKTLNILGKTNYILPEQIMTVKKIKAQDLMIHLFDMRQVQEAMRIQFNLQ